MRGSRVPSAVVFVCTALAAAGAASADKILVLQFAGDPGGAHAGAPAALSKVMADAVRESGSEVNEASREDVLTLGGCGEASDDCLRQALGILEMNGAVTGDVRAAEGGVEVELRVISPDAEPRTRTVQVRGGATADLAEPFRAEAVAFWRNEPSPADAAASGAEGSETGGSAAGDLTAAADQPEGSFSASRVQPYVWAIGGGGAGLMAVGAVLLIVSQAKQSEVDDAPTDTVDQLEHLADLEASGRRYARLGNVCVLVGGVAAIVGGILIYKQGHQAEVTVAPSSGEGLGAALMVRGAF